MGFSTMTALIALAMSLTCANSFAQTEENSAAEKSAEEIGQDIDSFSLEDLMNTEVVTASKSKQKQNEAPSIISVVPREQLYTHGWFTLNDMMSHQAGFFPAHDYDRNVIGSRGLSEGWNNNHLLLLMDGVPFNDPMYGSAYTWENTPIWMIKSVEVIRGPGSALYGTNATNGVIAVQSMTGDDMKGRAEGRFRFGSESTSWMEAYTGNTAEKFSYFMGFSSFGTDGNSYDSYDGSGDGLKHKVRDDKTARYMLFKVDGKGSMKPLSFQYHDQSWRYQTGHGWLFQSPDHQDAMYEHRRVFTASYKPQISTSLSSEFTLKYERKEIDWNTRYAPDTYTGYPNGIDEYVNFFHDNYFARAQFTVDLGSRANILAGVEGSTFVYNGDKSHYSNTDLSNTFGPNAGNAWTEAPGIMGLIQSEPIYNVGVYTQFATGDWIKKWQFTAGLRYDNQSVTYDATKLGETGTGSRTFNALSPRLAAVFLPTERFSVKFLAGRAFRAPAPSELGGVNTWALANNIKGLNPETVTTGEIGTDWRLKDGMNWKVNAFYTKFEDQIGYSTSAANISTNIYTTETAGAETELAVAMGKGKSFANVSYSKRLSEKIADTTVAKSNDTVTWAPMMTANVGHTHEITQNLKLAGVAEYMSEVERRDSDKLTAANAALRGGSVDAWYGLNLSAHYTFGKDTELSAYVKNVLDSDGHLIKTRDFAFDYQREGRTYYLSLAHRL